MALAAATLALYGSATGNPFVKYDDDVYVTANAHVQSGLNWNTVKWAFVSGDAANWHPLTWISHATDWQLFGKAAAGHHATSVLIHSLNAVLLFLLLRWATGREMPSLLAAALFAFHPLNVESVAWISERKNVLCTFFFLATLGAYGWYAQRPSWRRYLAVAGLALASLMAKPMAITLPFVLLLLDYWPLVRRLPLAGLALEKAPLALLSAASALVTMRVQSAGGAVRSTLELSLGVRLENALVAYGMYLWKMVWPARLAVLYLHAGYTLPAWQPLLSASVLLGITALVWVFRSRRYFLVGWFWFLGTLVPVIGLVQVGVAGMADRYAYIPLMGIFVTIVWGLAELADGLNAPAAARVAAAVCVLAALGAVTVRQIGAWSSTYNLWAHTLAVTENNFVAHRNLAMEFMAMGRADEAFVQFRDAARLDPQDLLSQFAIGTYLYSHGRLPEALAQFARMTQHTADPQPLSSAFAGLGMVYGDMGDDGMARQSFARSLEADPGQANEYYGLGRLAEKQGRLDEAILDYSRLAEISPSRGTYQLLGHVLETAKHPAEAAAAYRRASQVAPGIPAEHQ